MSDSEIGQILYKGTMRLTTSDYKQLVMQPVYCNNCRAYLGAYNIKQYPNGLKFKCICAPEVAK